MKKVISFLLIFLALINILKFWSSNASLFFIKFDSIYFSNLYAHSQYVLGPNSENGIGDDGLYAFAGYYYFFQKGDVSVVNFEHPPFGKYLIGLSILLFKNELVINVFYFTILLLITYRLSRLYLDKFLSFIPMVLVGTDPLFLDHTIRSQLDLPFTLFFVSGVYFFIISQKKLGYIFLSQLFWAAAFSTRFFPMLVIIEIYMLMTFVYADRKNLKLFVISMVLVPVLYLVCHLSFFYYHPSFIEFLRHKKWMVAWFTGTPIKTGNIIRNFFTGQLLDTTDKLVRNKEWSFIQPIILIFSMLPYKVNLLMGFAFIYILYTVFLTGGQAKFMMPIFPIISILAVRNMTILYSIINKWMRLKFSFSKIK